MINYKQILKGKGVSEDSNVISALKDAVLQAVPIIIQEVADSYKGEHKVEVDYESILRKLSITEQENKTLNKDLFGKVVQPDARILFKSATIKTDSGFMLCDAGVSGIDDEDYIVTTSGLKSDEVPEECMDAKLFCELVAKLLNKHYS